MSTQQGDSARKTGGRPTGVGKSGRRPITPVKVHQSRAWGPIALFSVVILIAVGIVGFGGYEVWKNYRSTLPPAEQAKDIDGVVNYLKIEPGLSKPANHAWGPLKFKQSPPVAGKHNFNWQNCMGDVYDAPIANEHAVHSMEHGAVWLTYNPEKLSKDQVETLAKKVRGTDYMLMSPYPGLDKAVSVQAWGFQLKVDSVGDGRIDKFIQAMRKNAAIEPGATCGKGITEPGTTPRDIGKDSGQDPAQQGGQPG